MGWIRDKFEKFKDKLNCYFKNGVIYSLFDLLVDFLQIICLVEYFKSIANQILNGGKEDENKRYALRAGTDVFIVSKWVFIWVLFHYGYSNRFTLIFVWYLILTNFLSYFYYHAWSKKIMKDHHFDADRIKRRFFNLILAVCFSNYSFAYLFAVPYFREFSWADGININSQAINFSLSNSLTSSYAYVVPSTSFGSSIMVFQLVLMFVFVSILISGSVPLPNSVTQKENDYVVPK